METTSTPAEKDLAKALRLQTPPAPVTRVSRKALMALGAVASLAVVGAIVWAMVEKPQGKSRGELFKTDNQQPPEALATLPKDYAGGAAGATTDVPKLGPPLPGDLGRPMLRAGQTESSPLALPTPDAATPATADPKVQQLAQERTAARTSPLFLNGASRASAANGDAAATTSASSPGEGGAAVVAQAPSATPAISGQGAKAAFLASPVNRTITSSERVQAPASPYVIQAGAVIPAALITGLRSDLPGQITAQVTENVYDSPTGRYLLVPQGAKLIGEYDSQISFGQTRVLLAWTRLILPGGRSIVLEKNPGADGQGFAGLEDGVDHHWRALFGAALLSTVMGVGAEAGASDSDSQIVQALRQGASSSLNQVGQQVVGKSLDIQPTLTIRPGFPVRVIVTRDLVFPQENTISYSDGQTMPTGDGAGAPRP